jgi:hypothetical protein
MELAQQPEVDQRRDVSVVQAVEAVAASRPARLLGRAARHRHDQCHLIARREIDDASASIDDEPIGHELYRRHCLLAIAGARIAAAPV